VGDRNVGFTTAFSRDGRSILAEWDGRLLVYDVSDLNGAPEHQSPRAPRVGRSWSPDGQALVFSALERAGQKAEALHHER
jgi:hypothetical protein